MQTVILAAGRGTRMMPLTTSRPKPMVPVADRPLVAHVADAAIGAGASELVFVVGYRGETVSDHFGDRYRDVPVSYVEQADQRGTADALDAARAALTEDHFAVLNGDMLVEHPAIESLFRAGPAVGATRVDEPGNYGVLQLDAEGAVRDVIEKPSSPPSNLANAGAYVFPAATLEYLDDVSASDRGEYELTDVLSRVATAHTVRPVSFDRWLDVGRPWEILAANAWTLEGLAPRAEGTVHDDATIEGPVVVEPGATVREGVTIEGPVVVRAGASVGPNAYVRGPATIGPDAKVGHAVEITRSVLFRDATVGHLAYVGDSVIGTAANFGAGTTVANLRHDEAPVRTIVKGERVSTGRRKYGVVVGPHAKTGIDTSLNAGIVLPANGYTLPGETILTQDDVHDP